MAEWAWSWEGEAGRGRLRLRLEGAHVDVHAEVERPGSDLVVLHEPEAPPPRAGTLEIRSSGLWLDAIEEERDERWTIGVEAFALAVDDPADTVGVRVPLGFDLEWERTGPDGPDGVPARVHGEVLVGADALDLDSPGHWRHR